MQDQPQDERRKNLQFQVTQEQLTEAVAAGVIRALNSPQAVEAVEGAVNSWFDKQAGHAMRKLLNSILMGALLLLAINFSQLKQFLQNLGK